MTHSRQQFLPVPWPFLNIVKNAILNAQDRVGLLQSTPFNIDTVTAPQSQQKGLNKKKKPWQKDK